MSHVIIRSYEIGDISVTTCTWSVINEVNALHLRLKSVEMLNHDCLLICC